MTQHEDFFRKRSTGELAPDRQQRKRPGSKGIFKAEDRACVSTEPLNGEGKMSGEGFVDYYELLQVSPNADDDTIHRVFRHLAKKFHPDTPKTGNPELFNSLVEAYGALTDPARRAAYDARYKQYWDSKWKLAAEAADARGFINDEVLRERLLSLMYVQRRRSVQHRSAAPGGCTYQPLCVDTHNWAGLPSPVTVSATAGARSAPHPGACRSRAEPD